jgi:hypothetical protein
MKGFVPPKKYKTITEWENHCPKLGEFRKPDSKLVFSLFKMTKTIMCHQHINDIIISQQVFHQDNLDQFVEKIQLCGYSRLDYDY